MKLQRNRDYSRDLPNTDILNYYRTHYICWVENGEMVAKGGKDGNIPVKLFRIVTREMRFNKGFLSYLLLHHHNLLSFKIIEWEQHTPIEVAFSVQRSKINKSLFSCDTSAVRCKVDAPKQVSLCVKDPMQFASMLTGNVCQSSICLQFQLSS